MAAPGNRRALLESDFPEEFRKNCRQFHDVVGALRAAWGLYRVKSSYRRRIDESRTLAGRQLKGISGVMDGLAAQLNLQIRDHDDDEQLVREALRERSLILDRLAPHLARPVPFLYPLRHRVWERAYAGTGIAHLDPEGRHGGDGKTGVMGDNHRPGVLEHRVECGHELSFLSSIHYCLTPLGGHLPVGPPVASACQANPASASDLSPGRR